MGSITVPDRTLQRQKKPSAALVSVSYALPFRCHRRDRRAGVELAIVLAGRPVAREWASILGEAASAYKVHTEAIL